MNKPQETVKGDERGQDESTDICQISRSFAGFSAEKITTLQGGWMGRKRSFEDATVGPILLSPNKETKKIGLIQLDKEMKEEIGLIQKESPIVKKLKRSGNTESSSLIKKEAFPNSPLSPPPHIRLKERARRLSLIIIREAQPNDTGAKVGNF